MRKAILVLLLFFFLIPSPSVFADETEADNGACSHLMSDEKKELVKTFTEKEASLQESYAIGMFESLWNAVNINALDTLVFGNPYCVWFDNEPELLYGIFPVEQKETIIDPIFDLFTGVYLVALVLAIMIAMVKVAYAPLGGTKSGFRDDVYMYIGTAFLLPGFWLLAEQIFAFNWAIVSGIRELLVAQKIDLSAPLIVAAQDDFNFTDIIIMLAEWVLILFMNFVYMMRTFMIVILLGLGGLAILSLLFEKTRTYFGTWLQDFIGAVFMQSVHALYMMVVLLLVSTLEGEWSVFFKLFLLIMFIPMSSMVMSWLNLSSGTMASTIGMQGVNSIAGAVMIAKMGKNQRANKKLSNNKVPDLGNLKTTKLSNMTSAANPKKHLSAKSIFAKSGMIAGAAAGSVLGPGGAMLGAGIGGFGANALYQGPKNVAGGIKGITDTVKQAKGFGMSDTLKGLQSRRSFFGNIGEATGSMVGKGELGRSVGNGLSGVSRQRLFQSDAAGGFGGKGLDQLAKEFPGQQVSWMQTNAGSGFYMNDGAEMRAISPVGAADPSLSNGETRMMDYQFQSNGFTADENQQYKMDAGSTEHMSRISDPYIKGADGLKMQDSRMNANELSPSSYFKSGMANMESRNLSDRVADRVDRHQGFV